MKINKKNKRKFAVINYDKLSLRQKRFYKIQQQIHIKKKREERRKKRDLKKFNRKKNNPGRADKLYWKLQELTQKALKYIANPEKRKAFIKKYNLKFKKKVFTPYQKSIILGLKNQRKLRRKRYNIIINYKARNLHKTDSKTFWDFFESRKIQKQNLSFSVKFHTKQIFILKKIFRFFYGFLKIKILKKAYAKSKKKNNRFLYFYSLIENRLIVTLFRMNFVSNIMQAKQFIRHGFVLVNNKKMIFPNFKINPGDFIKLNGIAYYKIFFKAILIHYTSESFKSLLSFNKEINMHVKFRQLTGIFIYNKNNFSLKHYPEIFFGENEIKKEKKIDFHKNSGNRRSFNWLVKESKQKQRAEQKKVNPLIIHQTVRILNLNNYMPFEIKRFLFNFLLKY